MKAKRNKSIVEAVAVIPARLKAPELPELEDDQKIGTYFFEGGWRPDLDASEIGPDNYSVLENMMYSEDGPVAVSGYTKRTSTTSPFIT
jgi:hypothetical protein